MQIVIKMPIVEYQTAAEIKDTNKGYYGMFVRAAHVLLEPWHKLAFFTITTREINTSPFHQAKALNTLFIILLWAHQVTVT